MLRHFLHTNTVIRKISYPGVTILPETLASHRKFGYPSWQTRKEAVEALVYSRFPFTEIHAYMQSKNYPLGLDKSGKSVLRRRVNFFYSGSGRLSYITSEESSTLHFKLLK